MTRSILFTSAAASLVAASAIHAAAPKKAASPSSAPPIATYWMDVTTQSGMGAGMMGGGGRPSLGDIMGMMSGRGGGYSHSLSLRLASRTPAPAAPQADHLVPATLQMGPSLPLVSPTPSAPSPTRPEKSEPGQWQQPKGRILIYWGCGDHAGAGQPMVLDLAQLTSGKVPENVRRMGEMMGRMHSTTRSGPTSAPGFGEWPNSRDSRSVPTNGSLIGAHRVQANYAPPIAFTLGQGQDFMGPMAMSDGGMTAAGADLIRWAPVAYATGYALAMFGANPGGDMVMWSSSRSGAFANLDFLSPGEVSREITAGNALAPSVTQCAMPAEVVRAVPAGMVMGIGYGPEAHFADAPRNPKWAVNVRYKSSGSMMRGMGGMMGEIGPAPGSDPRQAPPPRRKRGIGLGDILGAIPH